MECEHSSNSLKDTKHNKNILGVVHLEFDGLHICWDPFPQGSENLVAHQLPKGVAVACDLSQNGGSLGAIFAGSLGLCLSGEEPTACM